MNKADLRKYYLTKRASYSKETIEASSISISDIFFTSFDLSNIKNIHLFLPIENKNEINTYIIFEKLLLDFPSIKILLSVSDFSNASLELIEYGKGVQILPNKFGIPEPKSGKKITPDQVDMLLIPLVIGDKQGNRIGYGKGFYDRLISKCRKDCVKIGLSIEEPIEIITSDTFDEALDYCISPKRVYRFENK